MDKFDEKSFDDKVAKSIVEIHNKVLQKNMDEQFNEFVNNNLNHLEKLYYISGLDCDVEEFYTYVFNNTLK